MAQTPFQRAREQFLSSRSTPRTQIGTGIRGSSPTPANPVVSTSTPFKKELTAGRAFAQPLQAQEAIGGAAAGRGAFDITDRGEAARERQEKQQRIDLALGEGIRGPGTREFATLGDRAGQEGEFIRAAQKGGATTQEAIQRFGRGDRVENIEAGQAASRGFFRDLAEQGISQDELIQLTGARDALQARDILEGRAGLGPESQAVAQKEFAKLLGKKQLEEAKTRAKTEEEQIKEDIQRQFAPQFSAARDEGKRAQETSLRLAGRAALGSKEETQQLDISERQREVEQSIGAQQRLEERRALAVARGASSEEIDGINNAIQQATDRRQAVQQELELRQAGLDEATIARGDANNKIMLDALKAGFDFDPETQTFTERAGAADQNLQFVAPKFDDFGNQLTPAYTFDKSNGQLNLIDAVSGTQQQFQPETNVQFGAANTFKGFEEFTANVGSGQVIKGSPYHKGLEVDIDGQIGDPINSFAGGTVIQVSDSGESGFGKSVIVENEDGVRIRYAHLDDFNVKEGQRIPAGALVGAMGNTGSTIAGAQGDGSHLHIEARDKNGNLVSLQDIRHETPRISGNDVNQLRAQAFQAGYTNNDEVMGYINSVKNGFTPPNKQALGMDDRSFARANTLRDEFDNKAEVKEFKAVQAKVDQFKRVLDTGIKGPADLALVYSFMQALDPGSVVKEGEFNAAAGSGGMFKGAYTRFGGSFDEGQILPDNVRNDFLTIVQQSLGAKKKAFDQELSRAESLSLGAGVEPEFVLFDYSEGIEELLTAPRSAAQGSEAGELGQLLGVDTQQIQQASSFLDFE